MARRARRGFMLLASMLLAVVMLIMGIAMLVMGSRAYADALARYQALQARYLAEFGVDDAYLKLSKDVRFPGALGSRQYYGYSDDVYDPVSHGRIGKYTVVLDVSHREGDPTKDPQKQEAYAYPNFTIVITSHGYLDGADGRTVATHTIVAELDVSPKRRDVDPDPAEPETPADGPGYYTNPNFVRFLRWEDSEAY